VGIGPLTKPRLFLFRLVMLAVVVGTTEVASYVTASWVTRKDVVVFDGNIERKINATLATSPAAFSLYKKTYDADLGWVNVKGANFYGNPGKYSYDDGGARKTPKPFPTTLISSYGDSFTHGDGVEATDTWTYLLGLRFRTNTLNFGVGGYGTDQAVLRLEKNLAAGVRTRIVILGIETENINRTMGSFRAFYTNDRCIPCATNGPKPFFKRNAGGWDLIEIGARPSLPNLRRDIENSRKQDYWCREITFPYTVGLIRYLTIRRPLFTVGVGRWDVREAQDRMLYLVKRFAGLADAHGFMPVVLFIPDGGDFASLERGTVPAYKQVLPRIQEMRDLRRLLVVDVLEDGVLRPRYRKYGDSGGFGGHPTPEGHRIIAEAIEARMEPLLDDSTRGH